MVSQKPKYSKNLERNSHWRKLSMIMVWEHYCNASPKPEFFLLSLFIFSFISRLIWVHLGWNFHRWFSIQKQVNWCTIDPFSLKFCTSQHSYPVLLMPQPIPKWYLSGHGKRKKWVMESHGIWFSNFCENPGSVTLRCFWSEMWYDWSVFQTLIHLKDCLWNNVTCKKGHK